MKVGPYIGWAILVIVFASAILGMLMRRKLPESHLSDETKSVVTLSMGVVGTLTALVLSLLIATASSTFNTRDQEITVLAAKVIQLEHLLQRYGPEADGEREVAFGRAGRAWRGARGASSAPGPAGPGSRRCAGRCRTS